jgi:hypothetical protein
VCFGCGVSKGVVELLVVLCRSALSKCLVEFLSSALSRGEQDIYAYSKTSNGEDVMPYS